jgi:aspartate carbamoyltransferase catalytic subunit
MLGVCIFGTYNKALMKHVLEAQQFDPKIIDLLFNRANELQLLVDDKRRHQKVGQLLEGKMMFLVFYEPSTRTRISFAAAGQHLGMQVVTTENAMETSSATKGESLEDTIRVMCEYKPDVIVLRHFEELSAKRAAKVSTVPIINAGDGAGQHPSQALLDLYTIQKETSRLEDLTIILGGDLLHARTSRSLAYMMGKYPKNKLIFVSQKELRIGNDIKAYLKKRDVEYQETDDLEAVLPKADVIYWPRIQKERFKGASINKSLVIGVEQMKLLKKSAVLMSPLPRVDEITTEVDQDPRAAYFRQAGNGMYVRMALIEWSLGLLN